MSEQNSRRTKTLALIGIGCAGLLGLCCPSASALYWLQQSDYEAGGIGHAERFLGSLQRGEYGSAFGATAYLDAYLGDAALYNQATFERCIRSTVLGDLTGYECGAATGSFISGDGVDVECTVTSAAHGENEVTLHVNSPEDLPYLGFIWFPASAWTGPEWHEDECATWSGREYFREAPEGRVRP